MEYQVMARMMLTLAIDPRRFCSITPQPLAINERGQVVGPSSTSTGDVHAALWEHGAIITLGGSRSEGASTITGRSSA
jgi:probable HAF family extracellular repeat protein